MNHQPNNISDWVVEQPSASELSDKRKDITKEDIQEFTRKYWGGIDPKYAREYQNISQFINMSDFDPRRNCGLLEYIIDLYISSNKFDSVNAVIANKMKDSIKSNLVAVDFLSKDYDVKSFICKLNGVSDTIGRIGNEQEEEI